MEQLHAIRKRGLEKIQTEAAIIATGATKLISLNALFSDIQWEFLQDRRHNHQLAQFHKMHNHLAPEYLTSLAPQPVGVLQEPTCIVSLFCPLQ